MIKKFITKHYPPLILGIVVLLLFLTNYKPGTYLTGWDNLHPEFYFSMNIQRSLFAVWQEYQGLGLLGGMGHAADLVRQLFLLTLSLIVPESLIRYSWTFLMLFVGSSGAYYLIRFLFTRGLGEEKYSTITISQTEKKQLDTAPIFACIGALFYLLNLSTMQTFYAPFEAFIGHYGFLPWLLLASLRYYIYGTRKSILFLFAILFLATPQAYIPTLFVVYIISISVMLFGLLVYTKKSSRFQAITQAVKLYSIILLVNAFWLLPFAYFTFTNVSVTVNAKINQMATQSIFAQNKEFGTVGDVALLKGFWFNNVDPNLNGVFTFMLEPWRMHLATPLIVFLGYLLFAVILIGFIREIRTKNGISLSVSLLFLFGFTMLATATPPFSWINELIRSHVPIVNQAFRFPFTKFSTLTALTYAIFLSAGSQALFLRTLPYLSKKSFTWLTIPTISVVTILLIALPVFSGNLIYDKEKLSIPQDYFKTFQYFKEQDQNARIANFPQHTFWGWEFYRWPARQSPDGSSQMAGGGYGGSGFLWYGIKQPILDRAFDVWSEKDENYYNELSTALYAKDLHTFENVLQKYQVKFILIDQHVYNPISPNNTFYKELQTLLQSSEQIQKDKDFGKISIYKVALLDHPKSYVFTTHRIPTSNNYQWGDKDSMYQTFGNYSDAKDKKYDILYPFRSLFSGKTDKEKAFQMQEHQTEIVLSAPPLTPEKKQIMHIPGMAKTEKIVAATITTKKTALGTLAVNLTIQTPTIFLNGKKIWGKSQTQEIFRTNQTTAFPLTANINGVGIFHILNKDGYAGTGFLSLTENNSIVFSDTKGMMLSTRTIPKETLIAMPLLQEQQIALPHANGTVTVSIPKINDTYTSFETVPTPSDRAKDCNVSNNQSAKISQKSYKDNGKRFTSFSSQNATACVTFYSSTLPHNIGYALFIDNANKKGRGFHFWVLNEDEKYAPLDTYLPSEKKAVVTTFVLPPQEPFGKAYSFHFENIAIGTDQTENALSKIGIFPIPYNFLTRIWIGKDTIQKATPQNNLIRTTSHPNESLYTIQLGRIPDNTTVVLSQSYDPGWKAYTVENVSFLSKAFPFFFGQELKNHVEVNNWENGWHIGSENSNKTIVLVYLPQYLEYTGFVILFLFAIYSFLLLKSRQNINNTKNQESNF